MHRVAVVDYGMGNIDSVARAVDECGGIPVVSGKPVDICSADRIILPGVGSFSDGMSSINSIGLREVLTEQVVGRGIPFLGICLGMQLLAEWGHEGGRTPGLGWIKGEVVKLASDDPDIRIPHAGWNEVTFSRDDRLFSGIDSGRDFYFVHSYHVVCGDSHDILASTPYCEGFSSAVSHGNIYGVQFHPEKSQRAGFALLKNFISMESTVC